MARSTHITAYKSMMENLRLDPDLTLNQKLELLALARKNITDTLRLGKKHKASLTQQELNTRFQENIENFDREEEEL